MVAKHVNKKNAGKPLVLAINALLHSSCCSCCNLQCCGFLLLSLIMMQNQWILHEFDVSRIRPRLGGLPHLERLHGKIWLRLRGLPAVWQTGQPALTGHPTYHVNVIKLTREIIWTGGLPHLRGLPHLPGVPHLHVNRPLHNNNIIIFIIWYCAN